MKRKLAALAAISLTSLGLAACSSGSGSAADPAADPGEKGFDVSTIKADPAVEKLVPADIKKAGVLKNGASVDYAPAEYMKADNRTPTGYDVDMVKAIAKVMGLKDGTTTHGEFDSLIPQIGTKYDIGVSGFSITKEREAETQMVSYAELGFSYGVAKDNPKKFDPKNPCGKTVGVQTGTAQQDTIKEISKQCEADGKPAVSVKEHKMQTEIVPKVTGGQYDAVLADSPVVGYAVKMSGGELEIVGKAFETAQHGVVVNKDNEQLAKAVQAALQKLMDDGTLEKIFAVYGADSFILEKAEINPKVSE